MFLLDSLILSAVSNIDIFQYLDDFVSKMQAILQALLLPVIFPMAMVFVGISAFKDLSEGKPFGKKILGVILRIVVAGVFSYQFQAEVVHIKGHMSLLALFM
jgi:hypothetical protein